MPRRSSVVSGRVSGFSDPSDSNYISADLLQVTTPLLNELHRGLAHEDLTMELLAPA